MTLLSSLKRPLLRTAASYGRSSCLPQCSPQLSLNLQQHRTLARSTFRKTTRTVALDKRALRNEETTNSRTAQSEETADSGVLSPPPPSNRGDWIPPNRPLTGDSGHSHLYIGNEWEEHVHDEQLKNTIKREAERTGRFVQYFDLDKMDMDGGDWKQIEKNLKKWDSFLSSATPPHPEHHPTTKQHHTHTPSSSSPLSNDDEDDAWQKFFEHEEQMIRTQNDMDAGWEDIQEQHEEEDTTLADDPVLRDILSDKELFSENDEESLKIQLQLIGERLKQLRQDKRPMDKTPTATPTHPWIHGQQKGDMTVPSHPKSFIPPSPSNQDTFFQDRKEAHPRTPSMSARDKSQGPDWLKTRRDKLRPTNMMLPAQAEQRRTLDSTIPVIPNTLLSSKEIVSCLESLGGQNITVVIPDEKTKAALGWDGLIIATGSSYSHIRVMSDALVKNLRKRDLASKQVIGAMYGAEGGDNNQGSSSFHRRKTDRSFNKDDGWLIVDCRNYVVHIQDEATRKSIDLEGLWSPGERGKEGRAMRQVSSFHDLQMDDYVARNPIPDEYTYTLKAFSDEMNGIMSNTALKLKKKSLIHGQGGKDRDKPKARKKSRF